MSARTGIPLRSLHNYLSARSEIPSTILVTLAEACAVDLKWLATGEGHETISRAAHGDNSPPLDEELMEIVILQTTAYIQKKKYKATPEETSRLVIALYNMAKEERAAGRTSVNVDKWGPIIDFGQKPIP